MIEYRCECGCVYELGDQYAGKPVVCFKCSCTGVVQSQNVEPSVNKQRIVAPQTALSSEQEQMLAPAGFWIRVLASFADNVIIIILSIILAVLINLLLRSSFLNMIAYLFSFTINCIYYTVLTGENGQTWGKKLFGIKVIKADGTTMTYGRAFGRCFAFFFSYLTLGVGFLLAGWNPKKRALHDFICGTKVIRTKKAGTVLVVICSVLLFVIVGSFIGTFAYVFTTKFNHMQSRQNEGMTKGSLVHLRSALNIYAQDHGSGSLPFRAGDLDIDLLKTRLKSGRTIDKIILQRFVLSKTPLENLTEAQAVDQFNSILKMPALYFFIDIKERALLPPAPAHLFNMAIEFQRFSKTLSYQELLTLNKALLQAMYPLETAKSRKSQPAASLKLLVPKYLPQIDAVSLGKYHADSSQIITFEDKINPEDLDKGGWAYDSKSGSVYINCTHTDSKGVPMLNW